MTKTNTLFLKAGKTALHISAESGHLNLVELLMKKKAYANAKSKVKLIPVLSHLATSRQHASL